MEKLFYNFDNDKDKHETLELFNILITNGEYLKTINIPEYNYIQTYYKYNNRIYIITKREDEYLYIERMQYNVERK